MKGLDPSKLKFTNEKEDNKKQRIQNNKSNESDKNESKKT